MTTERKGSCMCEKVAFTLSGKPRFVSECVCSSCRRAHGASVVGWVGVKHAQFQLDSGTEHLSWYASSEDAQRAFCAQCGSRLLFRSSRWPGETHVALAAIKEPHDLVSTGFSFAGELPGWTAVVVPRREKRP